MHKAIPLCALALCCAVPMDAAAQSLRGSPASIERMYRQARADDLAFYETSGGVRNAVEAGRLVALTGNADYRLKDVSQPYVLPATRTFVQRIAAQYREQCGEKLVITSGTRPQSMRLANSTSKTVHPTGMAVDLRRPTGSGCLAWLRRTLSSLEEEGVLEATEERNPPHFHVAVFPDRYSRYVSRAGSNVRLASATKEAPVRRVSTRASGSATYKVRRGDSLWTIARRQNVSVEVLRKANALRSSNIVAGQLLAIPSGR
ncbi:MAG: LysM peptidoglycan-binding domain-containing protein [Gemmatimonadetes bacterium]|nr:LysM peptidoglycan-binding domain-containing protein [Gemmatimonadota bacterium]